MQDTLKASITSLLARYKTHLMALIVPLGIWGVGVLAFIDSASIALPIDFIVAGYVWHDPRHLWLYCLNAAAGSAVGALVPFFVGRAGGELFLLKRINRKRYEQLRDRFESQEFLAIMVPAMMPPPMPMKLLEFAAGVFEMKTAWFALAIFCGRLVRFSAVALLTVKYGPNMMHLAMGAFRQHLALALTAIGLVLLVLAVLAMRQGFRRQRRTARGKLSDLEKELEEL